MVQEKIMREGSRKFNKPAVKAVAATETSPAIAAEKEVIFHFSWWYALAKKTRMHTATATSTLHINHIYVHNVSSLCMHLGTRKKFDPSL